MTQPQPQNRSRTTVAVTVDGVIIDWITGLKSHVAARLAKPVRALPDIVSWDLSEWGVDDPQPYLHDFLSSAMAARVAVIDGAAEGLAQLREAKFTVLAVTRREHMVVDDAEAQAQARDITKRWFAEHPELGVGPRDLVFTADPVALRADVWLDNAPRRVERLLAQGKPVWLMPQPWNRSVHNRPGVKVLFEGWGSINDLIAAHS